VLITDQVARDRPLIEALLQGAAPRSLRRRAEAGGAAPISEGIAAMDGVSVIPLDVSDPSSVKKLAAEIGGKTDILINTRVSMCGPVAR
jgi:NAD(P)-dependent dehydrogenase (short-subunit alcohol dehydrogenase family)